MGFWRKNTALGSGATEAGDQWWSSFDLRKMTFVFALLSWGVLLTFGIAEQSMTVSALPIENQIGLKGLLLNALIFNIYVYNWAQSKDRPLGDFYIRLWKAFVMGGVMVAMSALLELVSSWSEATPTSFRVIVETIIFYIEFLLLLWFLLHIFIQWKSAILYEHSRFILYAWNVFEVLLFTSIVLHFFEIEHVDRVLYFSYFGLLLLAGILCFNIRWVDRLTTKQRLYAILMLLVLLASMGYFSLNMLEHFSNESMVVDDVSKSIFVGALFSFDAGYAIVGLLVTLFHLPAISSFEEKFQELVDIEKLNGRLEGKNRRAMLNEILDSAIETTHADSGWLEAPGDRLFIRKGVTEEEAVDYQKLLKENGYDGRQFTRYTANYFLSVAMNKTKYSSILAVPIKSGRQDIGTLVLLKKRGNAFDHSMVHMVNAIVTQVGISIHNKYLLEQAQGDSKFQKGLHIAKGVQDRLIPPNFDHEDSMKLYGISYSEDGIGGDYYDYYRLSSSKYVVFIADVAGKGIGAAFTMAQLKGIFQSLAPQNLMPNEFLKQANTALAGCLEKGVFVTATYYYIETKEQKVYFSRAGHCPTLYMDHLKEQARYFENNGLGLGIITTGAYENFIELNDFIYASGDIIVLYTDGILEAANKKTSEEYGYDRLRLYIENNHQEPLESLAQGVIDDVKEFIESSSIQDDYTVVLMKMK